MATTDRLTRTAAAEPLVSPVTLLRIAIILAVLAIWEFLAHSGLLYRDVVPSLFAIGKSALRPAVARRLLFQPRCDRG